MQEAQYPFRSMRMHSQLGSARPCFVGVHRATARSQKMTKYRGRHLAGAASAKDDVEVAELMKAADELISKMGKTRQTLSEKDTKEEGEELERQRGMTMVCDETSCVIVPLAAASNVAHGPKGSFVGSSGQAARKGQQPRDFVLMEGEGWKLGYDRDPINTSSYTALIGSDTWSVSLTRDEFTDFLQLLKRLQKSIATLETCGEWGKKAGGEDRKTFQRDSTLELETKRVWAQARAPQKQLFDLKDAWQRGSKSWPADSAFHLRFIITAPEIERQREFEGHFPPKVVMRLLNHLDEFWPTILD